MNLQDYKKRPRFYKIIDEESEYYGEVYKGRRCMDYFTQIELDLGSGYRLHIDYAQEVVPEYSDGEWKPMRLGDEYVCVGDEMGSYKIYEYYWQEVADKIHIVTAEYNDFEFNDFMRDMSPLTHTPLHPTEEAETDDIQPLEYIMKSEKEATVLHSKKINELVEAVNELQDLADKLNE